MLNKELANRIVAGEIGTSIHELLTGNQACNGEDTERWFSDDEEVTAQAVNICQTQCPVLEACLAYSLNNKVSGIWGGTDVQTRRLLRRKLGIKAAILSYPATK